jgi:hypothetical protein
MEIIGSMAKVSVFLTSVTFENPPEITLPTSGKVEADSTLQDSGFPRHHQPTHLQQGYYRPAIAIVDTADASALDLNRMVLHLGLSSNHF